MQAILALDDDFKAAITAEVKQGVLEAVRDVQVETIKPYMDLKDVYKLLSIGESTFNKHFVKRGLPIINIGTRRVVAYEDLVEFLSHLKTYDYEE